MKYVFAWLAAAFFFTSCSKDKTGAGGYIVTPVTNSGTVQLAGAFYGTAGIEVKGNAKVIFDGTVYTLLLDSFSVTAGPDLKVYLSKKDAPFEFINLGPLKAGSGNQNYAIPAGVDFSVYKYALVHCQQYNHLFAIAALKP